MSLPERDASQSMLERWMRKRGISHEVINSFVDYGVLYQHFSKKKYHIVYIGTDSDEVPQYAAVQDMDKNSVVDAEGSSEHYNFSYRGFGSHLYVFDSHLDMLSYATLRGFRKNRPFEDSLLTVPTVSSDNESAPAYWRPPVIIRMLSDHPKIRFIHLCFSNTEDGRQAAQSCISGWHDKYFFTHEPPPSGVTYNDHLLVTPRK